MTAFFDESGRGCHGYFLLLKVDGRDNPGVESSGVMR